ncbi:hypothetical protein T4E_11771 [Trichinella pseudospiralis]|uniref:Uncharacterized protein n=1 Tax=Trichinella pseudospiralis TaxID=6337 RepID=A0A0V0YAK3_TRIPS|nr:hypothetical protein T4E_11771 [Trichinella pseudospiralis]
MLTIEKVIEKCMTRSNYFLEPFQRERERERESNRIKLTDQMDNCTSLTLKCIETVSHVEKQAK